MPERQVLTALTGTVAPLVTVDVSDLQQLDMASFFLPRSWKKSTPFVSDDVTIQPTGQSDINLDITFELPKQATLISDIALATQIPPYTVTPAGNPAFFVDHPGYALIDYFSIHFGSNKNYDTYAYDLYFDYRKKFGIEKQNAIDQLIYGDTTTAQRSSLLLNGTPIGSPLITDLAEPFSMDPQCALPLVVLSQKTRFQFKSQPLQNITQTPVAGTTLTTVGKWNFQLLVTQIHTTGAEAERLVNLARSSQGISYMIHQHVRQFADDFASTQSGFVINCKLAGMTKPLRHISWALVPTKLINNTGRNDMFFFNPNPPAPIPAGMTPYSPIVSWGIEANGQIVQRQIIRDWSRILKYMQYYEGFAGEEIYTQNYAQYPLAVNAATGYLDYTNLNNPVLIIITGTGGTGTDPDIPANPQSLRVVVNASDYNFWFFKSGNWSRTFN